MDDEDVESEGEGDPPFFRPDDDNEPAGGTFCLLLLFMLKYLIYCAYSAVFPM